ncbi:MAG TPA: N-acetylmuramidase domain-containing protein [Bryobacteraceae bacterium]|nr:N-acetylmuramidase domain-containing protein [Bryobacteraceae bacterium]
MEFVGKSQALSTQGLNAVSQSLSVQPAEIWTVLAVETSGCGFLADRRPPILFERHIFSKLTNRKFDVSDVSNPQAGGYGPSGANQYTRLANAIQLDRSAALQSASWGLAQIMGMNFATSGFSDVETMVSAMSDSEDAQLHAFVSFLKTNRLDQHLQSHNWAALAKGYNGPNYAINQYDTKLAQAYQKYSAGPLPDLTLRAAQLYLTFAGMNPGPVDGMMGTKTKTALQNYQQRNGLPQTGLPDDATMAKLVAL